MKEIKVDKTTKGTRILLGEEKAQLIRGCESFAISEGFTRISIPILQFEDLYTAKVGEENQKMMYTFSDRGGRELCLAPEYTAVVQDLATNYFKHQKDVKLFYTQECFRGEKPQAGRYRQFTQFGIEILNPTKDYTDYLIHLALCMMWGVDAVESGVLQVNREAKRGLDYYNDAKGFEVTCDKLGAQKQVCGGGAYEGGVGFAIGIDRVMLIK